MYVTFFQSEKLIGQIIFGHRYIFTTIVKPWAESYRELQRRKIPNTAFTSQFTVKNNLNNKN